MRKAKKFETTPFHNHLSSGQMIIRLDRMLDRPVVLINLRTTGNGFCLPSSGNRLGECRADDSYETA
jgi:hypothetical protein